MPIFSNGIFFGLIAMLAWGVADYFAAVASRKAGSFLTFALTQIFSLIAYAGLFLFVPLQFTLTLPSILLTLVIALLMIAGYFFFYKSLEVGKVAVGTAITACWGLLTAIFAVVFLGETLTPPQLIGIGLAVLGIILTSLKKEKAHKGKSASEKGVLFALLSLAAWGVGFGLFDSLIAQLDWFHGIFFVKLVSSLLLLPFIKLKQKRTKLRPVFFTLMAIGLLETVAYLAFGFGLTQGQIAVVGPVSSTYPIVAVVLAGFFLKEKLNLHQYLGLGAVIAGMVLLAL